MLESLRKRLARHARIRSRVEGSSARPRLSVFRSNASIYAQLIDDSTGKTLVSANDLKLTSGTKAEKAAKVGEELAKKAVKAGVTTCVFDRGGFRYHGRVKALADGARSNGLSF